ncbi:hypothetical protein PR048_005766 [Dryococelus australis]|uniref:DDE-1 domain-containing protein n=1 Tax=Dryococelus australis TaxID=614101 RepID=A0ABQ9IA22_9NEOP|nr:hypothetical protein PR048_005766 [Dryococelus australis]
MLISDGHRSHLDNCVLDVAESLEMQLFRLPAHCSHELQPLDKSFFKSLKVYWNSAPGHKNAIPEFRVTGIFTFNPQVNPETVFAPSMYQIAHHYKLGLQVLQFLALWRYPQYQQHLQYQQPAITLQLHHHH